MTHSKISEKKLFTILAIDLFSMTGLIFPSIIVRGSGTYGLPVMLLSQGLGLLAACYFLWVTKNGEIPYVESIKALPSMGKKLVSAVYGIRFFLHGLFLILIFRELIKEVLLPKQNALLMLLPFFILVFLSVGKGVSVRGTILEVLFPYVFVPLVLVLFLGLLEIDYASLPAQIIKGQWNTEKWRAVYTGFLFFQPVEFLLFLAPFRKPEKRKKGYAVTTALLFVLIINVVLFLTAVGMFGSIRTGEKLWSSLYIMQSIKLPGHFVERLDILFLVFYIFSTYALFSGYLFYSEMLIISDEKSTKKKWYPILYLTAGLFLAVTIKDVEQFVQLFLQYKMWIDVPLAFLLPFLLQLGKREQKKAALVVLAAMLPCFLYGCQTKVDIEDRNYVMTLGVEEGEKEQFRFCYELADLSKGKGTGKKLIYSGSSFRAIEKKAVKSNDKQMDYGHLKALLISKELFIGKEWGSYVKELKEKNEIAGTTFVFFTEESPEEYIEFAKKEGTTLGEYLERICSNHESIQKRSLTLSELLRQEAEGIEKREIPYLQIKKKKLYLDYIDVEKKQEVTKQVLRFHIRANSDSEKDQTFKNQVKDEILPYLQQLFAECQSKEESVKKAEASLLEIEKNVKNICEKLGQNLNVSVFLCQEAFPLKQYGNIVLPSGIYDALRIDLGKGEGANWWCMMYPSLCLKEGVIEGVTKEAEKNLEHMLEEEEYESLFDERKDTKIHVKWKITEVFSRFFGKMSP